MRLVALVVASTLAAAPAFAQRAITVLDGARKIPVSCQATMTVATVSTAPIACTRMDVPVFDKSAPVTDVPAGLSLVLTDARLYCDLCNGQDFSVSFYGQMTGPQGAMTTVPFPVSGVAPVADWHGVSPFLVVPGGSRLRIGGVVPAGGSGGVVQVAATGHLVRTDLLGQ